MGLLDEAIKEHLELKRRHGADPGEVARLEHEALGPARRDPAPAAIVDEPVAAEAAQEPVAPQPFDADDVQEHYEEVPADERLEAPIHHIEPEVVEPELAAEVEPEPAAEVEREPATEVEPAPPAPAEPAAEVEQPTRQFSLEEVEAASEGPPAPAPAEAPDEPDEPEPQAPPHAEDVVPADDEPEGDDVLEETPEFLQETPEHDRLWFEQKPPRDFDF
jgi:hypothetical protein